MIPEYVHADHLSNVLPRLSADMTIGHCLGLLQSAADYGTLKYDTFAFCGMSGALIAPILAYNLRKDLLMIRKKGDDTHSSLVIEGNVGAERIVVVDDFINEGNTVGRIVRSIRLFTKAQIVGLLLYHDNSQFNRELHYPGSEEFTNMMRAGKREEERYDNR